jgi:hypothetical protein
MVSVGDKHVWCGPLAAGCLVSTVFRSCGFGKERSFESDRKFHACDPSKSEPEPDLSMFECFAVPFEL